MRVPRALAGFASESPMPLRPFVLLAATAALSACGGGAASVDAVGRSEAPIINGTACEADAEPTVVAILVDATVSLGGFTQDVKTVTCTGTLIAPDVVLTAAHCV